MRLARLGRAVYKIAPIRRYVLMRDINENLDRWDVLPLGDKLKSIRKTHSVVLNRLNGGAHNFPRDFGFRLPAGMLNRNDLVMAEKHLRKRLGMEEQNLNDMKNIFRDWGVKLDPKKIPHPFGTSWEGYDNHMIIHIADDAQILRRDEKEGQEAVQGKNSRGTW